MQWLLNYQLYLFDFDGLLVNTEELHYKAYREMCLRRGHVFDIDFPSYCEVAHYTSKGLSALVYATCPQLKEEEPNWDTLYKEKTAVYLELLSKGEVQLMPGVERMLNFIEEYKKKACVVTHSAKPLIEAIRKKIPALNVIPFWITREDYKEAKPEPDSYRVAIERNASSEDRIIGFEDTPRGINALMGTHAKAVIVTSINYPEIPILEEKGVKHYRSFNEVVGTN